MSACSSIYPVVSPANTPLYALLLAVLRNIVKNSGAIQTIDLLITKINGYSVFLHASASALLFLFPLLVASGYVTLGLNDKIDLIVPDI